MTHRIEFRLAVIEPDGTEHVLNDSSLDLHDEFNAFARPPSQPWLPETGEYFAKRS